MRHLLLPLAYLIGSAASVSAQNDARPPLGQLLEDARGSDAQKKGQAIQSLRSRRPSSSADIQSLLRSARGGDARLKEAVAESLGLIPAEKTEFKDAVIALLDDKEPALRLAAVRGCRTWNARETAPRLRKLLHEAPRSGSKSPVAGDTPSLLLRLTMELASALAQFKDLSAVDEILSRGELMSQDAFIGPILARFGADILPKIIASAKKGVVPASTASSAISSMRDEDAIPGLAALIDDPNDPFAAAAARALDLITPRSPVHKRAKEAALEKLAASKNESEPPSTLNTLSEPPITLEAIRRENRAGRLAMFYSLVSAGREEAAPMLKEFIAEDDQQDTTDRKAAGQAIFRLTGERVQYMGIESDRQLNGDPYGSNNF